MKRRGEFRNNKLKAPKKKWRLHEILSKKLKRFKRSIPSSVQSSIPPHLLKFSIDVYEEYEKNMERIAAVRESQIGRQTSTNDTFAALEGVYSYICDYTFSPFNVLDSAVRVSTNFLELIAGDSWGGKQFDVTVDVDQVHVDLCCLGASLATVATAVAIAPAASETPAVSLEPATPLPRSEPPQPAPAPPPPPPPLLPPQILPTIPQPPDITLEEARQRIRSIVPFCNPDGFLPLLDQLARLKEGGNTGRPLPPSVDQLIQSILFCQVNKYILFFVFFYIIKK